MQNETDSRLLLAPPPRDPELVAPFLRGGNGLARGAFVGGLVIVPLLVGLLFVEYGQLDVTFVVISLAVGGLVSSLGLALSWNQRVAREVLTRGSSVSAKATRVTVSVLQGGVASFVVRYELTDQAGRARQGEVHFMGPADVSLKEGDALVALEHAGRFALHVPGLGAVATRPG